MNEPVSFEGTKYGAVSHDVRGWPICHICGQSYRRLMAHVRQKHFMTAYEYKKMYGLNTTHGICSADSADLSRDAVIRHYDKVVAANLLENGKRTRITKGSKGRTRDQLCAQERNRLVTMHADALVVAAYRKSGQQLGKSGLGNKKRWGERV